MTSSDLPPTRRAALLDMADRYEASRHPTLKPGTTGYAWLTEIAEMCHERAQDYPEAEPVANGLVDEINQLRAQRDRYGQAIDIIREGGDNTPAEPGTHLTTAQAWTWLISADPAERIERLGRLMAEARVGFDCFTQDHVSGLGERQRLARASADAHDQASVLRQELAKSEAAREAAEAQLDALREDAAEAMERAE